MVFRQVELAGSGWKVDAGHGAQSVAAVMSRSAVPGRQATQSVALGEEYVPFGQAVQLVAELPSTSANPAAHGSQGPREPAAAYDPVGVRSGKENNVFE